FDSHRVSVAVAEMGSHKVDHGDNLVIAHRGSKWRHSALSIDHDGNGVGTGLKIAVTRKRWISSSARGASGVRHVATLADPGEQGLAVLLDKYRAGAKTGIERFRPHLLRAGRERHQAKRCRHRHRHRCTNAFPCLPHSTRTHGTIPEKSAPIA